MTTPNIHPTEESKRNTTTSLPTFQQMREGLHISHSQISQYMICPLKFQFQYVQGLQPEFIGAALPFGSAIHHTIAILYKQLQATDRAPSKTEVQEVFADRWEWQQRNNENIVEVKFKAGKESWETWKDMGVKMIGAYYDYVEKMSMLIGERVVGARATLPQTLSQDRAQLTPISYTHIYSRSCFLAAASLARKSLRWKLFNQFLNTM